MLPGNVSELDRLIVDDGSPGRLIHTDDACILVDRRRRFRRDLLVGAAVHRSKDRREGFDNGIYFQTKGRR